MKNQKNPKFYKLFIIKIHVKSKIIFKSMNKIIKEFTVQDWVNGTSTESHFRIQITDNEKPETPLLKTMPEAQIKIKKLKNQYFQLLERNKSLEEQLYNSQCQIRALQASNILNNQKVSKNLSIDSEIQNLAKDLIKSSDDSNSDQSLLKQIHFQTLVIEDLMCKLQNMHHRIEYYKEDVSELKSQYEKEKSIVELEKQNSSLIDEKNQEALQTIEKLKAEIEEKKLQLQESIEKREVITKILFKKSEFQIDSENLFLEEQMEVKIQKMKKKFASKIFLIQQNNKKALENLGFCMNKRMNDLRNFYEYRIKEMIKEYSFEEAKFHAKILSLKNEISEFFRINQELETKIRVNERRKSLGVNNLTQAEATIKNLSDMLEKMSFGYVEERSQSKAELDYMSKRAEEVENDIKNQYSHQLKIAEKSHLDAMNGLKARYQKKIEKINIEFQKNEKKLQDRDLKEQKVLFEEISRLEKEKTETELLIESKVQKVIREAKAVTPT